MPGNSPRCAISRKRIRETPYLLRKPRGRPSIESRPRTLIGEALRGSFCNPRRAASRESSVPAGSTRAFFQLQTLNGVALDDNFCAVHYGQSCFFLAILYRSSRNSTCLRTTGSYFFNTRRSGSVTTVLPRDVGVSGTCGGAHFDNGPNILCFSH